MFVLAGLFLSISHQKMLLARALLKNHFNPHLA